MLPPPGRGNAPNWLRPYEGLRRLFVSAAGASTGAVVAPAGVLGCAPVRWAEAGPASRLPEVVLHEGEVVGVHIVGVVEVSPGIIPWLPERLSERGFQRREVSRVHH